MAQEAPSRHRSRFVAATTRTSTARERAPPTGRTSRPWSTRSSVAWKGPEVPPTSSRKSVPPSSLSGDSYGVAGSVS